MTPTPAAEVVSQVFQFFTLWTVQALNGYMSALPNPVPGNAPVHVPVYPAYQDPKPTSPACLVKIKPAPHPFGAGESLDDTDDLTGVPSFEVYIPDARLDCAVYSHLPGMTGYLADCLYSGMLSNVALNPITGSYVENAVGKRLAEAGLTVVGLADWQELGSNPSSERPYGQYFSIHVVFACNIDVMWVGGVMQVPPILMQSGIDGYPITETFTID